MFRKTLRRVGGGRGTPRWTVAWSGVRPRMSPVSGHARMLSRNRTTCRGAWEWRGCLVLETKPYYRIPFQNVAAEEPTTKNFFIKGRKRVTINDSDAADNQCQCRCQTQPHVDGAHVGGAVEGTDALGGGHVHVDPRPHQVPWRRAPAEMTGGDRDVFLGENGRVYWCPSPCAMLSPHERRDACGGDV